MSNEIQKAFDIKGIKVPYDANGLASMTGIWIAAGRPKGKKPDKWRENSASIEFIDSVASKTESGNPDSVLKVIPGKGTWGHWQIALAYAKWMSPEIHQYVNEGFRQWQEEERSPGLKLDRAVEKLLNKGWTPERIEVRLKGKVQRELLCSTIQKHMGTRIAYWKVSDIGNLTVVGKTAKEYRQRNELSKNEPIRDHMDKVQLAGLLLYEASTEQHIIEEGAMGDDQIKDCAMTVSSVLQPTMKALRSKERSIPAM